MKENLTQPKKSSSLSFKTKPLSELTFKRKQSLKDPASLTRLLRIIQSITGFDARAYRDSTIRRRLELRLQETGCQSIDEYIKFVSRNHQEAINFKENLLIHVTRFFRDRPVFTYFERRLLPAWLDSLVARNRRILRVWSVGCASGQEPFSLAMILYPPAKERGLHPIILATDISTRVLARGREALFSCSDLRYVPKLWRKIYFTEERYGFFRLSPLLRRLVVFRQHDFIQEKPPGLFDLILCRNLLIFFKSEAQELLLQKLIQSLAEGGLLILGRSERINPNSALRLLSARFCIYQKNGLAQRRKVSSGRCQGGRK